MSKIFQLCNSIVMVALLSSTCLGTTLEGEDTHQHHGTSIALGRNNQIQGTGFNEIDYQTKMRQLDLDEENFSVINNVLVGCYSALIGSFLSERVLKGVIKSDSIRWGIGVGTFIFSAACLYKLYKSRYDDKRKDIMRQHGVTPN
ncbi:hypothetical protein IM40_11020 (plasmid) [Candidatus Paracaedimonas acanthamoebae]|nr:hypothetical protein IM40_11020 [Candidatus Paracaedimonas acanthamoebae]